MKAALQTATTLLSLCATAALLVGFGDEVRNTVGRTADSALALVPPFLAFAAGLAAITSAATGLVLALLCLPLLMLAFVEGEGNAWLVIGTLSAIGSAALMAAQIWHANRD